MKVSVIIPLYNAGKFIESAVKSALNQEETGEVIIIEDGSKDNGLEISRDIILKYDRVKLYTHENNENLGAAASRNLGIIKAKYDFIAFLDADDFFLPNRFKRTKVVFDKHPDSDGVYEAIGVFFENKLDRKEFKKSGLHEITMVKKTIDPKNLFKSFLKGGAGGYFSLVGFTAKKKIFYDISFFDENMKMFEDTFLILKFSAKSNLYPGELLEPIALRRVHNENRITRQLNDANSTTKLLILFWKNFAIWSEVNLNKNEYSWVLEQLLANVYLDMIKSQRSVTAKLNNYLLVWSLLKDFHYLALTTYFWKINVLLLTKKNKK